MSDNEPNTEALADRVPLDRLVGGESLAFNVNSHVRVKLNDLGREIYMQYYDRWGIETGPPKEEGDGYSRFQLHELMSIFGEHMGVGFSVPFETTVLLEGDHLFAPSSND